MSPAASKSLRTSLFNCFCVPLHRQHVNPLPLPPASWLSLVGIPSHPAWRRPDNSSLSGRSAPAFAVISFDFSSVFTCPSTTALLHAQGSPYASPSIPRLRSNASCVFHGCRNAFSPSLRSSRHLPFQLMKQSCLSPTAPRCVQSFVHRDPIGQRNISAKPLQLRAPKFLDVTPSLRATSDAPHTRTGPMTSINSCLVSKIALADPPMNSIKLWIRGRRVHFLPSRIVLDEDTIRSQNLLMWIHF